MRNEISYPPVVTTTTTDFGDWIPAFQAEIILMYQRVGPSF
jgi:hypothetical protein